MSLFIYLFSNTADINSYNNCCLLFVGAFFVVYLVIMFLGVSSSTLSGGNKFLQRKIWTKTGKCNHKYLFIVKMSKAVLKAVQMTMCCSRSHFWRFIMVL